MVFIKVLKTRQYYKRYQVKYRRRREAKTDYFARRKMVIMPKNKFASPRYRLVVRIANKQVTCQIVHSKIQGDFVMASAYSNELKDERYGLKVGLKNYSACYCTGLLVARRLMYLTEKNAAGRKRHSKSKSMEGFAEKFEGLEEDADGQYLNVGELDDEEEEARFEANEPHAFKAVLDVGLQRTTLGARIFGCLKGAVDGGLNVPHSENLFPGYEPDQDEEDQEDLAEVLNKYIHGGHVGEYMEELEDEDEDTYKLQFAQYIANDLDADSLEELYNTVHKNIRENPEPKAKPDFDFKAWGKEQLLELYHDKSVSAKGKHQFKLVKQQRDAKVVQKKKYGQYCYEKAQAEA